MTLRKKFFFLLLFCFSCTLVAHGAYEPPMDKILVFMDTEGGVRSPVFDMARVPQFCLYESGELIYSYYDQKYGCVMVKKATLEEKERESLLAFFRGKGFEEWSEYYEDTPVKDMPVTRIWINDKKTQKKVNITGIDYAIKNRTIPEGLIEAYRKLQLYSNDAALDYETPVLILYVRKLDEEPKGAAVHIYKWGPRIDLSALASDSGLSGYGSVLLEGKNAKQTLRELEGKAPYSRPAMLAYFRQGKNVFSLGYRVLLPHEPEAQKAKEKEGKKGKK
jgi:hypothetical protein